jgi:tRNA modification GTPase
MYDSTDTIVALASARQAGARGVVRVGGPQALAAVEPWIGTSLATIGGSPRALDTEFTFAASDGIERSLPVTLLVWPGAQSFTRQPMVEVHTLGSLPLLEALVRQLSRPPCRLAEPGEFTFRAFLSGRIDLTQAEAVLGVIDAQNSAQLDTALSQLAGGMSRPLVALREEMLMLVAELEAGLDFAEEEVEFIDPQVATERIRLLARQIGQLSEQLGSRGTAGALPRVVLTGPPNAGKSSLFNSLVARFGSDGHSTISALVSPQPGATRDYLAATLRVGNVEFELVDTAGVGKPAAQHPLDHQTQAMTKAARTRADLLVLCSEDVSGLENARHPAIAVRTKCDEVAGAVGYESIATSALTGEGVDDLAGEIVRQLEQLMGRATVDVVPATANRCGASLRGALAATLAAEKLSHDSAAHDLVVHELRHALDELGQVAGVVATDDILDRVFRQFCIGK